jgi:adenine-specific DNA-methyltransferase
MNERYQNPDNDPRGAWCSGDLVANEERRDGYYEVEGPTGSIFNVPRGKHWVYSKDNIERMISEERIWFGKNGDAFPRLKRFLSEVQQGKKVDSLWLSEDVGHNQEAKRETRKILDDNPIFDTPKPVRLINQILRLSTSADSVILDFFAGSGTTAQAVMELNLEDGGKRQCICVQMPEVLDADTEAYQAGYRTIADITRARIGKVIDKLKTEQPEKTADLACAHFTLAPSNFKVWRGDVADADALREQLALFQQAEKGDGSCDYAQDDGQESSHSARSRGIQAQTAMLAELLLKHGLGALGVHAMSKPILLAGITIHRVLMEDDRQLWLCFEPYTEALKDEIARAKPAQVILLNSCFVGDKADELLSNLQLELQGLEIGLLVI